MTTQKPKAEFEELGRVKVSDTTEVVLSTVTREGEIVGININNFITSRRYTGFSGGGVFVPTTKVSDFVKLVNMIGGIK